MPGWNMGFPEEIVSCILFGMFIMRVSFSIGLILKSSGVPQLLLSMLVSDCHMDGVPCFCKTNREPSKTGIGNSFFGGMAT